VTFDWAAFVNVIIAFLITAAVVYFFVVMPMNRLAERRARGEEPKPQAPSEEVPAAARDPDALAGPRDEVADPPPLR